jgi:DedD protein
MISLPSFFKNKSSPISQKIEPTLKPRQSKIDLEKEEILTENPEVQRARHRLLGAGFLLLIAVIGLPRLFDAEPKKINNDVVVKVVQSVTSTTNKSVQDEKLNTSDSVLIQEKEKSQVDKNTSASEITEKAVVSSKPIPSSTTVSQDQNKKGTLQTDPGEVVVLDPKTDASKTNNKESPINKTDLKNQKYIVQVAALSSNDRVKNLTAKIKELKIETYVIEKKKESPNSPVIYLVRAGPFSSKEEAVNAEKKISTLGMGLSPSIIEVTK